MTARTPLTVLIPTFNNIDLIADLIADVRWADQILVVNSLDLGWNCRILQKKRS